MKNNILKNSLLALLFLVNVAAFAGTVPVEVTPEETDPAASINSNILLLGVAGILVGAYYFTKKQNKTA